MTDLRNEKKLLEEKLKRATEGNKNLSEIESKTKQEYKFKGCSADLKHQQILGKVKLELTEFKLIDKYESEKIKYLENENLYLCGKARKYDEVSAAHHKSLVQLDAFNKKTSSR